MSKTLAIILAFTVFLACFEKSNAQTCEGNFGTPVVKIDFGSGEGPVPIIEFPNYTTNMTFTTSCPQDGAYQISNKIPNCFSSWLHDAPDHTGNTNGRMFIANADDKTNVNRFFETTITGLSGGQAYNFSAWITSIVKNVYKNPHSPCNVKFSIFTQSGSLIKEFSTGDIPALAANATALPWKKFGIGFILPKGETGVKLLLSNNILGGYGNDLAIDDIEFVPVGPCINIAGSSSDIGFSAVSTLNAVTDYDPYTEGNQTYNYGSVVYQWQMSSDGSNWQNIQGANSGSYSSSSAGAGYYRLLVATSMANLEDPNARISSNVFVLKDCKLLCTIFGNMTARISGNQLIVSWTTLSEMNTNRFEIEVSKAGQNKFVKVDQIASKASIGNSNLQLQYNSESPFGRVSSILGLPLLAFAFMVMGFRKQLKTQIILLFILALSFFAISCKKSESGKTEPVKVDVRVAHIDKAGNKIYSKTVTAFVQ